MTEFNAEDIDENLPMRKDASYNEYKVAPAGNDGITEKSTVFENMFRARQT
jgi:hypothetical protein